MSQEDGDTLFYALRILPHAERDIEAHLVRIADMAGARQAVLGMTACGTLSHCSHKVHGGILSSAKISVFGVKCGSFFIAVHREEPHGAFCLPYRKQPKTRRRLAFSMSVMPRKNRSREQKHVKSSSMSESRETNENQHALSLQVAFAPLCD